MKQDIRIPEINWKKMDNLVPTVVQNHLTGRVLMQGFMNSDALEKTIKTGQVTFFSRSKNRLWTKGEDSGNALKLVTLGTDCDQDSILIQALPVGPTCHLGSESCFNDDNNQPFINRLATLINKRRNADADSSYTASLLQGNSRRVAQKVGEEGVEVALAAATNDRENLTDESADLLYHLLVLLEQQELPLETVIERLFQRHC